MDNNIFSEGDVLRVGVLKEVEGENRVSIVPGSLKKLNKLGFQVVVESGAGTASHNSDEDYEAAGSTVSTREDAMSCDVIVSISMPDISNIKPGQILVCVADPFRNPKSVKKCAESGITLISMDKIPRRLSRAQAKEENSSQDNHAG